MANRASPGRRLPSAAFPARPPAGKKRDHGIFPKKLAVCQGENQCYFPCGMGAVRQDGTVVPNGWNAHPAPIVEPLLNYHLATGDPQALSFARAYANGILAGIQPGGLRFGPDRNFAKPPGHSHATMHALWGVAHLGIVTGEVKYVEFEWLGNMVTAAIPSPTQTPLFLGKPRRLPRPPPL